MADNKNIKDGNGNLFIMALKQVGSVFFPRHILSNGTIDAEIKQNVNTLNNELLVNLEGHECPENTTTTPLLGDGVFNGSDWQDTLDYGVLSIAVGSDVDSAIDGLVIQWSTDQVNIQNTDEFSILAGVDKTFTFGPAARYYKVKYTNGVAAQNSFYLVSLLRKIYVKPSSHRIQDAIVGQDDAELVKSVLTGLAPDGTFKNALITNAGNQKISIEEFETAVSTNSNTQLRTTLYDETGIPVSSDPSTESLQIINYEHHEIHGGSHYFVQGYQDLTINQVLDFTWLMPNTTKWIHWTWEISTESETLWSVYENVVATNPLANTITPLNNNRNSANTSGTTMKYEVQTNLAAANADTNVGGATLLATGISGAGRDSGMVERSNELVMKQNNLYCLRAIASAAGYISFRMEWYEHTDKN